MKLKKLLWQIREALRFYFQASTIYNIHSPLLFSILKSVYLSDDLPQAELQKNFRNALNQDNELVSEEVGAGSSSLSKNTIAKAIKLSSSSYRKSSFIAKIAQAVQSKTIIELGTNLGMTTTTLSYYNPFANVHTVEANDQLLRKAKAFFINSGIDKIHTYNKYFQDFLNTDFGNIYPDFILIDGDHSYQSTMDYFKLIKQKRIAQLCLVFDDIRWSKGMLMAWNKISSDTDASVVVDFHNLGVVLYSPNSRNQIRCKIISHRLKPFNLGLFAK